MLSLSQWRLLPIIVFSTAGLTHAPTGIAQALPDEFQIRDHINGLRSAALSQPLRATSIVAFEISSGSFHDSDSTPGLAHLAEHLILRHRVNGDQSVTLRDFLTLHGGRLDAKTTYENTRFYFEISNEALPTLLDSLRDVLTRPQLNDTLIASEIASINDEFSFLKAKLDWRLRDALKAATTTSHPFRRFQAGNFQSFSSRSLSQLSSELSTFFREHYSAANISLILITPHSSADQQDYISRSFGRLPSSNLVSHSIAPLFDTSSLPLTLSIRENVGTPQLQLLIPANDIPREHVKNAIDYLAFWTEADGSGEEE